MTRTAGIINLKLKYNELNALKRYLLFFDVIGVVGFDELLQSAREASDSSREARMVAEELEWLRNQGFLLNASFPKNKYRELLSLEQQKQVDDAVREGMDKLKPKLKLVPLLPVEYQDDIVTRTMCYGLTLSGEFNDYDLQPILKRFELPSTMASGKTDIVNIVVSKFPVPTEDISWEQIIDFKTALENPGRLAGLRVWIASMSKSGKTVSEINDELEYNLSNYRQSLTAHGIKYSTTMIETFVVGSAEILENIVKLNFKNTAKSLFIARTQKAELMLAELNAPGRQLGYIYDVNEKFGR